ncbi:MAG TPA: 4Fe-4S binding protein [Spirochaetia bacterium]|nr:4Fe-4S binding protein [Spirochaetia bacterium]
MGLIKSRALSRLKSLRIASQLVFLALFVFIFLRSLDPFSIVQNFFLRFDPLIFLTHLETGSLTLAGIILLLLITLLVGRFFCGWVCPMGTLIDVSDLLLSWIRKRLPFNLNPLNRGRNRRLGAKALIRTPPALFLLGAVLVTVFFAPPILQFLHPNVWIVRIFSLNPLGIGFMIFVLVSSVIGRRFWCIYLCPLGALYGFLSRFSLYRLEISRCSRCGKCTLCPMGAADYQEKEILQSQCTLCFDYEAGCPVEGFSFTNRLRAPVQESRRRFLETSVSLAGGALAGGILSIPWGEKNMSSLLRPPGVVDETQFVERCLRCLQCVRSCPNRIIQVTGGSAGLGSLFTPHIEFARYGCDYYCQVCQTVCPNYAIPLQSLENKQKTPIGKAVIDTDDCVVYKDGTNCLVCEEFCPVPEKAIQTKEEMVWKDGKLVPLKHPFVVESRCIGCGICQVNCPASPIAITVRKNPRI